MSDHNETRDSSLSASDAALLRAYLAVGVPTDELPYSDDFERLFAQVKKPTSKRDVFERLLYLRKTGQVPALGAFGPIPGLPKLSREEVEFLSSLVTKHAGSVGRRDRLPYTTEFEQLADEFQAKTKRCLAHRDLWLLILRRAKAGAQTSDSKNTSANDEEHPG